MGKKILFCVFFIVIFVACSNAREFTVQVSAFQEESEAKTMAEKLLEKNFPAYYIKADLGSKGIWYRVRLGRFATSVEAQEYGKYFKKRESLDFFVTVFEEGDGLNISLTPNPSSESPPENATEKDTLTNQFDTSSDTVNTEIKSSDTESLPVFNSNSDSNAKVPSKESDTETKTVILSLNEVIDMKSSKEDLEQQYKYFMEDMDYADKIYVSSRKTGSKIELQRAYEVYKKIASDYFFLKEVYKAKYKMALCLRDMGMYNDSIQILKNIIPELPKEEAALIQYEIGFIYYQNLKKYSSALDELDKVIEHYPDTVWAKEAKDLIHIIMTHKIYVVDQDYEENSEEENKNGE